MKMHEYFTNSRLTLEDAFKIFDSSSTGEIPKNEFFKLLNNICGFKISEDDKVCNSYFNNFNNLKRKTS